MASEWVKSVCGGATESDLMKRAEKVEQDVPGAKWVMRRVLDGRATIDQAVAAGYIGLTESSLNEIEKLDKKIESITDTEESGIAMVTKLGMIRELIDTALKI